MIGFVLDSKSIEIMLQVIRLHLFKTLLKISLSIFFIIFKLNPNDGIAKC